MLDVDGRHRLPERSDGRRRVRRAARRRAPDDVTVDLDRPAADFVDVVAEPDVRGRAARRRDATGATSPRATASSAAAATSSTAATATGMTLDGQPALLGRAAGDRDDRAGHRHRRPQPGRGVRGRRPRLRPDRRHRRVVDRLRRDARAAAAARCPRSSTEYYGFDTSRPPFDDVRVRQAFAPAVDWRRIARARPRPTRAAAGDLMVPPGIPGRSDARLSCRRTTRRRRASCSRRPAIPGGAGFPTITLMTGGGSATTRRSSTSSSASSGSMSSTRRWTSTTYFARLASRPAGDLGARLGRGLPGPQRLPRACSSAAASTNNYGHWSSPEFDAAIAEAGAATDPAAAQRGLRPRRDDRPARRAGRPGRLRDRLGAGARRPARRRPERPRDHAHGGAGVGRLMPIDADRPRLPAAACRSCLLLAAGPAAVRRRGPASFGTPTATARFGQGHRLHASPSTLDAPSARVELLVTVRGRERADRRSRCPRRAATGAQTLTLHHRRVAATATSLPEHAAHGSLADHRRPGGESAPSTGPSHEPVYADERFAWKTQDRRRSSGSTGTRATTRSASGRSRSASDGDRRRGEAPRRHRDRARRLLHLRRPGRVLRRARAGRPARTSAARPTPRSGRCSRSSRRARSTTRWVGDRHPPRADPPRLRHGGPEPVPLPAALAQRGPGGLPERGLRRRRTARAVEARGPRRRR